MRASLCMVPLPSGGEGQVTAFKLGMLLNDYPPKNPYGFPRPGDAGTQAQPLLKLDPSLIHTILIFFTILVYNWIGAKIFSPVIGVNIAENSKRG